MESNSELPTRKKKRSPRDSRPYVHDQCGQITVASGNDFSRLANPFAIVTGTVCVSCQANVSLGTVAWQDTGESIRGYRRRLRRRAPTSLKLFAWIIAPLTFGAGAAAHRLAGHASQGAGPFIRRRHWAFFLPVPDAGPGPFAVGNRLPRQEVICRRPSLHAVGTDPMVTFRRDPGVFSSACEFASTSNP